MSADADVASPRVTLVVACYNHAPYLRRCLESVAAQTLSPFTLIVTDDASTDDSQALITRALSDLDLQARTIFHSENRGICATFNAALISVRTPFVAFLSTDDYMAPTRLARQLEIFDDLADDVAFLYGDMPVVDHAGNDTGDHFYGAGMPNRFRSDPRAMYEELLAGNFIAAPSVMMRTAALRQVGGYDETLSYEDYDVWCRLARHYAVAYCDEPLVYYRRGVPAAGGSLSDQLQAARRVQYLVTNIRILAKHRGQSAGLDRLVTGRAYSYAMEAYKLGSRHPAVFSAMIARLRAAPSGRAALLTFLALGRFPIHRFRPPIH